MSKAKSSVPPQTYSILASRSCGIDVDHAAAQNFGAAADGLVGLGEECGAAAEQHAAVGSEPVVVEIVLRIVDHAVARAEFVRQRFRQNFGRNNERADGDEFLLQRGSGAAGVAAGADEDFVRPERAA